MRASHITPSLLTVIAIIAAVLLSACGSEPPASPTPTNSPAPTRTPTPQPTKTPTPTITPTPEPELATPRWMLLNQPYFNVEILGEQWDYYTDNWGEMYACIRYRQNDYKRYFEQCFGIINENMPTLTYDGVLAGMLESGFEEITPNTVFPNTDRISLSGKKEEENQVAFFEIVEAEPYILLVEMYVTAEEDAPLQEIYEAYAADVMDYVLLAGMQKSKIAPAPSPTPMSPEQQSNYDENSEFLITENEANELYYGRWELLDDYVWEYSICREFQDRTNADVLWVSFVNCVYTVAPGTTMQAVRDHFLEPDDVLPESRYAADNYFVYGYGNGHLYYNAVLYENGLVFRAVIETRSLVGTTAENGFTEEIDDYLYAVLMKNLEKSK